MKKVLVLLTLAAAVSAYSQGTVVFNNRVTTASPQILAPISYGGGVVAGITDGMLVDNTRNINGYGGVNAMAALYGGAVGTPEDQLVLLFNLAGTTAAVPFRSGALAGFVNVGTDGPRILNTVAPLGQGVFQIRAWDAGQSGVTTYEQAVALATTRTVFLGKSAVLQEGPLGGGSPPATPPNMVGLTGFSMVPEPSIIGLGILGAVAGLMVFRRRN